MSVGPESAPTARHPRPPELANASLEEIVARYVARFRDRKADWAAFEDAKMEGYKRAQHRFIGAGGSGKHADLDVIPPRAFTLSIMYVEPGQGNAAHTHEIEEIFRLAVRFVHFQVVFQNLFNGLALTCSASKLHGLFHEVIANLNCSIHLLNLRPTGPS